MVEESKGRKEEVVSREYTINLHKRLHGCTFKKKAPKAIKKRESNGNQGCQGRREIEQEIWSRGIRGVPRRIRVRISHKRNDDEDAKEELYSLVTVAEIPAEGSKGLGTKVIVKEIDLTLLPFSCVTDAAVLLTWAKPIDWLMNDEMVEAKGIFDAAGVIGLLVQRQQNRLEIGGAIVDEIRGLGLGLRLRLAFCWSSKLVRNEPVSVDLNRVRNWMKELPAKVLGFLDGD